MSTVHVIGAGLAGLAAATRLAEAGRRVVVHEAAGHAGGRCRSFHDPVLDRRIDNGSHLVLSGNRAVLAYLDRIGAADRLVGITPAAFPFLDLRTGETWTVRPGRPVPGVPLVDHLSALRLLTAGCGDTVGDRLDGRSRLFERLWGPLAVSGLNTAPGRGSARLLAAVLRQTFLRGEAACRPLVARDGLSDAFVEPALAFLAGHRVPVRCGARVRAVTTTGDRVTALQVTGERFDLAEDDAVVLAVPPPVAADLVRGLPVPATGEAIVNAHYRLNEPVALPGGGPFLGLIGGEAEWLFARGDVLAVTVSAADRFAELPAPAVADRLWRDAAQAIGRAGAPVPPARVVKERRATFDQTPGEAARRPATRSRFFNLALAGDWINTGLPATLEGAIRSGEAAASLLLRAFPVGRRGRQPFSAFTLLRSRHI